MKRVITPRIWGAITLFVSLLLSVPAQAELPSLGRIVCEETGGQAILPSDAWKGDLVAYNMDSLWGTAVNAVPYNTEGSIGFAGSNTILVTFVGGCAAYLPGDVLSVYQPRTHSADLLFAAPHPAAGAPASFTVRGQFEFCVGNAAPTYKNGLGQTVHTDSFIWHTESALNADGGNHYKTYIVTSGSYQNTIFFGLSDVSFDRPADRDFNNYVFSAAMAPSL